jgi:hypothetical protein
VCARRVLLDLVEGKMLVEFDAPSRKSLEKWLADEGFHYDGQLRVELESTEGRLTAL